MFSKGIFISCSEKVGYFKRVQMTQFSKYGKWNVDFGFLGP
jgi:hypothetical protein